MFYNRKLILTMKCIKNKIMKTKAVWILSFIVGPNGCHKIIGLYFSCTPTVRPKKNISLAA